MRPENEIQDSLPGRLRRLSQDGTYYELLELRPFESNVDAIAARVRELMRETRRYQVGPFADTAAKALETLSQAMACLVDPEQKRTYDDDLRRRYDLPPIAVASTYLGGSQTPPVRSGPQSTPRPWTVAAGVFLVLAGLGGAVRLASRAHTATQRSPLVTESPVPGADQDFPPRNEPPIPAAPGPQIESEPARALRQSPAVVATRTTPASAEPDAVVPTEPADPLVAPPVRSNGAPVAAAAPPPRAEMPAASVPVAGRDRTAAPAFDDWQPTGLNLTRAEVLQELRRIRSRRAPAARLAADPQSVGWDRAVEIVKYARNAFGNDRRFQMQLQQEVAALERAFPHRGGTQPSRSRRP